MIRIKLREKEGKIGEKAREGGIGRGRRGPGAFMSGFDGMRSRVRERMRYERK